MNTITFECEIITPMFLNGADGISPEIRSPTIKGALRFWWRAMNGHLSITELRKQEADIFGGTDEKVGRSKVIIRTNYPILTFSEHKPVPHKSFTANAYDANVKQVFQVSLSLSVVKHDFNLKKLESLFILTSILGGFGKRVRRGFGSIKVKKINGTDVVESERCSITKDILLYLENISPNYVLDYLSKPQKIVLKLPSLCEKSQYPYIEEIEIGQHVYKNNDDLVKSVGNATHEFKGIDKEPSLGYVSKGERFASPVYVSSAKLLLNDYCTIITTLHMATRYNNNDPDRVKQKSFKNAIL